MLVSEVENGFPVDVFGDGDDCSGSFGLVEAVRRLSRRGFVVGMVAENGGRWGGRWVDAVCGYFFGRLLVFHG